MTDSDWLQYLEDRSQWERLSPAAKAVTDAAASAQWEQDAGGMRLSDVQEIAAAALRAAADQVQHHWDGMECVDHLQAIAAELEGTTPNPLEPNDLSHLSDEEFQALAPQGFHGL